MTPKDPPEELEQAKAALQKLLPKGYTVATAYGRATGTGQVGWLLYCFTDGDMSCIPAVFMGYPVNRSLGLGVRPGS